MTDSVPVRHDNEVAHRRLLASAINRNRTVVRSVTLTLSSATTTVTDEKMGEDKSVILTPTNSAAASEAIYLSSALNGSFVLTHANAGTTRTFDYMIVG